nr:MAG TPA: hypothetical protein [Caudoviricetes sp.]
MSYHTSSKYLFFLSGKLAMSTTTQPTVFSCQ